jgi:hypothetical protein
MSQEDHKIDAKDRAVFDVLNERKYTVDYFQREYSWEQKHIEQLVTDELTYLLLPPSADDAFARSLFAGLQTGKLDLTNLSEDLKHYLTPKRLGEYNSSLMPLGPLQALSLLRATTTDGLTTRDYDVIVGGQRLHMHLLLLPDKKVEDVSISRQ